MQTWKVATKKGNAIRVKVGAVGVERFYYPAKASPKYDLVVLEFPGGQRETFYRYMLVRSKKTVRLDATEEPPSIGYCVFCGVGVADSVCDACQLTVAEKGRQWRFPLDSDALRKLVDVYGVEPTAALLSVPADWVAYWRRYSLGDFSIDILDALEALQPAGSLEVARKLGKPRKPVGARLVNLCAKGWVDSNGHGIYRLGSGWMPKK